MGNSTQAEFARKTGVSGPNLSRWLSGDQPPNIDNLRKLSKATKVPLLELLVASGELEPSEARMKNRPQPLPAAAYSADEELLLEQIAKASPEVRTVIDATLKASGAFGLPSRPDIEIEFQDRVKALIEIKVTGGGRGAGFTLENWLTVLIARELHGITNDQSGDGVRKIVTPSASTDLSNETRDSSDQRGRVGPPGRRPDGVASVGVDEAGPAEIAAAAAGTASFYQAIDDAEDDQAAAEADDSENHDSHA